MTKEEMLALMKQSATAPTDDTLSSGTLESIGRGAKALYNFIPGATDPNFVPQQQMGSGAGNPYFAPGGAAVASDMPTDTSMSAEQMRHALAQMAPAVAAQRAADAAPLAPPIAGAPAPGLPGSASASEQYKLSTTPGVSGYAAQLALGETQRGGALESLAGTNRFANANAAAEGIKQEAKGEATAIGVDKKRADEQHSIDEQSVSLATEQQQLQQRVAQQAQAATDQQMMRVQQAADEASAARVHNFWEDKSTGARVLGVLAQIFAGAANGLAGNPSAPTPLDRVIARDMELQQLNMQQSNRKLENERSVMRDIWDKVGNQQQANAAYYIAAWKRVEAQGNALKTKYANETADAAFDKLQGVVKQRVSEVNDKTSATLYAQSIQQQQHGINILAETERTDAEAGSRAAVAQQAGKDRFQLPGFKGDVSGDTYTKFKEATEGYTTVMAEARAIQQVALDYKNGQISEAEALEQYRVSRSALLSAQRLVQKTGAALSPEEYKNLQAQLPDLTQHFLLPDAFNADIEHQSERITSSASRRYLAHVHGRVAGLELNDEDPEYGSAVRGYRTELVRQHRSGIR